MDIDLIIICIAIIAALKIIIGFIKYLISRNDPPIAPTPERKYVDELVSEEKYFEYNDEEPYFKRLYKRTWEDGVVEYVTSED